MGTKEGAARARDARARKREEELERLEDLLSARVPLEEALGEVGIPYSRIKDWRYHKDPRWARLQAAMDSGEMPWPPSFVEFRHEVFGLATPAHQQPWVEHLEHGCKRLMVLTFPEAGKTTFFGRDWCAYLVARERARIVNRVEAPPLRAAYVTNNASQAGHMSYQVRQVLTDSHRYPALLRTWGPFRHEAEGGWRQNHVYVRGRSAEEKEPSLQWLGWQRNIQGARLTDALLDDVDVATLGRSEREAIRRWLDLVVIERLGEEGRLIVAGNRVDEADLYSELLDIEDWHVVVQPAIDAEDNPTWPERFSREHYERRRREMQNDRRYSLVYLQKAGLGSMAIFQAEALEAAKRIDLVLGQPLADDEVRVAGIDPAAEGPWAAVVVAYARDRLRLIDILAGKGGGYGAMRDAVAWACERRPHYIAVERTGGQALFISTEVEQLVHKAHARLETVQTTGQGIRDAYYGISALASWFGQGKVEIPFARSVMRQTAPLVDELASYHFSSSAAKDRVMALWFAFRIVLERGEHRETLAGFGDAADRLPLLSPQYEIDAEMLAEARTDPSRVLELS